MQPHPELILEPETRASQYWGDLWRYRELFYFLAWRDLLVRYKQTVAGVAWAFLRPFITMIVMTIVFGKFAKLPSDGIPYPVLVFAALLPWQFFANALTESSNSLVTNANLIAKVYFPRLIVPAGAVITSLVDLLISGAFLVLIMAWYQVAPTWRLCALPGFTLLALAAAMGAGFWLSALTVRYRDFRFMVPFMVQIGFFVSPVGYSSSIVSEQWRFWYSLNPMVAIIDGFRWCIHGGSQSLNWPGLVFATGTILLLFLTGLGYFRRTERSFADVI